ncbi:OmpA family protein [Bacillus sonorensis]|nr:OmpA family protein [Bacillus sonorensis]
MSDLLVLNPPRNIVISGHTDNVPIRNSQFKSNWHLSVMRAVNFMGLLIENPKLDAKVFSAKGYGEYKPIASNKTEEGRRKNRRVEILILPMGQENLNEKE